MVQREQELDPVVASFLDMAREKIELASSRSVKRIKGVSCLEIGYFEQIGKASVVCMFRLVWIDFSKKSFKRRKYE